MFNKKGFTLVELLVSVVILGVVVGMAFPIIRRLRENNQDTQYTTYKSSLTYGAKLYVDSYSQDLFGYNDSGCAIISYNQLEERKLAKDIDINDVSCASEDTYVLVVKFKGKYTFFDRIGCGSKRDDGTVNVSKLIPKEDYTIAEVCGEGSEYNMIIYADPSDSYNLESKSKSITVKIDSPTGISNSYDIKYGFSYGKNTSIIGSWNNLSLNLKPNDEQYDLIKNSNIINGVSNKVTTPSTANGKVYLVLDVRTLNDISGRSWTTQSDKYLYFGPYTVDNEKPKIEDLKVTSKTNNYNNLKVNVEFKGSDNITPEEDLLMCFSEKSDKCNDYVPYEKKSLYEFSGSYDGVKRTLYVYLKDLAENVQTKSVEYTPYKLCTVSESDNNWKDITSCPDDCAGTKNQESKLYDKYLDEYCNKKTEREVNCSDDCTPVTKYTLKYDDNGGSGCSDQSITKKKNQTWGSLCKPTRSGYKFVEWKDGKNTVDSDTLATKNVTVKAEWVKNNVEVTYTLKYNDNGGSGCSSKSITKKKDEKWGTLCKPSRDGYNFIGWKNGGTTITADSKATSNVTVTAQWEEVAKCELKITGTAGSNGWYKSDVTVAFKSKKGTSYGIVASTTATYNSKTSVVQGNTTGVTYYGYVKNSSSSAKCSITFKVDKNAPTCGTATGSSTSWTSSNRTIKQACNDTGGSGCVNSSYDKTYSSSKKTDTVTISDKAGNTASCKYNVYVDKDNPEFEYKCVKVVNKKSFIMTLKHKTINAAKSEQHYNYMKNEGADYSIVLVYYDATSGIKSRDLILGEVGRGFNTTKWSTDHLNTDIPGAGTPMMVKVRKICDYAGHCLYNTTNGHKITCPY